MKLNRTLSVLLLGLFLASPLWAAKSGNSAAELLHLLDYIGVDYPTTIEQGRVTNPGEYAEQMEFSQRAVKLIENLPEGSQKTELLRQASELQSLIDSKGAGKQVERLTQTMQKQVIALTGITTTPRRAPSLSRGQQLFQTHCTSCHGVDGHGDGPLAASLTPPPIDFSDRSRQDKRSLYGLYNTISRGVADTGMRGYTELSEADRWALAFYTGTLPFSGKDVQAGNRVFQNGQRELITNLDSLTRMTPEMAKIQAGQDGVALLAYLRANPDVLVGGTAALGKARDILKQSLDTALRGDSEHAYRLAVSAYLDGFETAEAGLRNLDTALVSNVERTMSHYRNLVKEGQASETELRQAYQAVDDLLVRGQELLATTSLTPTMTFVSAMVILLREGLEALLVLAAIIALLIKADRRDVLPWVHYGWISALALGGVTWWVSQYVVNISGASREVTEGVTALLATAILLYVGFWLHSKTHAKNWQRFLQEKIHGALQGRTLWALTGIAFLAVYREVFETVLFLEALNQQTGPGEGEKMLWWGLLTGVGLLLLLAWVLLKTSLRLPLRLFFNVNAFILFILAIIFTGHGIAALQEAGYIAARHLALPEFDWVGFYPTVQTILGQSVVIAMIAGLFFWERYRNNHIPG